MPSYDKNNTILSLDEAKTMRAELMSVLALDSAGEIRINRAIALLTARIEEQELKDDN